jgi:hypothetical protein
LATAVSNYQLRKTSSTLLSTTHQLCPSLGLFALKAFPYLCKSTRAGEVALHGRFPQLQVAVAPADARTRLRAGELLDRVLQTATTGKKLEFLGLGADGRLGGDGAAVSDVPFAEALRRVREEDGRERRSAAAIASILGAAAGYVVVSSSHGVSGKGGGAGTSSSL